MSKTRIIHIYVEGKGEIVFLGQFISTHFGYEFKYELEKLKATFNDRDSGNKIFLKPFDSENRDGGIDNKKLQSLIREIKQFNDPIGAESIIIIDADTPEHVKPKGGFRARDERLSELQNESSFQYFIIPNHKDDGNLEDLLDQIISPKGRDFYQCLTKYSDCLSSLSNSSIPFELKHIKDFKKKRMEWYSFNMLGSKRKKEQQMENYNENELWDLESPSLISLRMFFERIFNLSES